MRRLRFAALAIAICLTALNARADQWSKTFSVTGTPDVQVETSDADIHVDTWDQKTIAATVTTEHYKIGEGGVQVFDHQTGDSVELEVRFPHNIVVFGFHSHRVDITVHMPREGNVILHTADGSIDLSGLKGNMDVESSDGRQDIRNVDGTLHARAGDGHVDVAGRFDQLQIESGDGSVTAQAMAGSTTKASWSLQAGDGSVTLRLPHDFAADLILQTGDGHIESDLPLTVEGRLGNKNLHGKLNGGGGMLSIHTGDGSIHLERS